MNKEGLLKFKGIFAEQRRAIVYANQLANEQFQLQKDDLLDEVDMTSTELETSMRIRLRNRETLLLKKIDEAIRRINEGSFGHCESCGDEIEMRRLEARPTTTLCIGCKEEEERQEFLHIDGHRPKSLGKTVRIG